MSLAAGRSAPSRPPAGTAGAILAGGQSRRFGSPKALARLGGRRVVEHVRDALRAAAAELLLVAGEPAAFEWLGLETRPDSVVGAGPLGGIATALRWADQQGAPGVLCVACDMPFLSPTLLAELARHGAATGAPALVPRSPLGVEPLCAWYSVGCLPEVHAMLAGTRHSLRQLVARVGAQVLPLSAVRRHGDPGLLFFNLNTPPELERAERILRGTGAAG